MYPAIRSNSALPSVFGRFDDLWEDLLTGRWPSIQHSTSTSRFASYEDEEGYKMQVTLPDGVTADQIKAEVKEGVLTLTIAKPEVKATPIEITDVVESDNTEK